MPVSNAQLTGVLERVLSPIFKAWVKINSVFHFEKSQHSKQIRWNGGKYSSIVQFKDTGYMRSSLKELSNRWGYGNGKSCSTAMV